MRNNAEAASTVGLDAAEACIPTLEASDASQAIYHTLAFQIDLVLQAVDVDRLSHADRNRWVALVGNLPMSLRKKFVLPG